MTFRFLENLCTAGLPDDCIKHIFFDMISVVIDISVTEVSKQYIYCLQVISNVSSLFNRS